MTMIYNLGNRVVNNYLVSLGEEDGYVLTHGKVKKARQHPLTGLCNKSLHNGFIVKVVLCCR